MSDLDAPRPIEHGERAALLARYHRKPDAESVEIRQGAMIRRWSPMDHAAVLVEMLALFLRAAGMLLVALAGVVLIVAIITSPIWLVCLLAWALLG